MSNDIVPLGDMQRMAIAVAKGGLFGVRTPDQALSLMLLSQSEGRHPMSVVKDYDIIQGRPAKKAEAMLRDFLQAGGRVEWHELTDTAAAATFSHPQGGSVRIDWDMQRADVAGLAAKDMFKKFPRQMLRSRCVSEGVRTVFPAATSGFYVPEEVRDIGPDDTAGGTTIETVADTADVLNEFASGGDTEPPPERNILAEARSASLRGVEAFRDFWVALSQPERNSIKSHLAEFEAAAKAADDPFGLPPTQGDMLNKPGSDTLVG